MTEEKTVVEPIKDPEVETKPTEEDVITIGEETPPQEAPAWVKDLRVKYRETSRENRELKRKLDASAVDKTAELGKKPTLEGCEHDEAKFEANLVRWKAYIDERRP